MIINSVINLNTKKRMDIINITPKVLDAVKKSRINKGIAVVCTKHTTTSICVNEECNKLQNDVIRFLTKLVSDFDPTHDHGSIDGRDNGRSHLIAHLLPHSECLSIEDGNLNMGTWQSIFFVELDGPREDRKVEIKLIGE